MTKDEGSKVRGLALATVLAVAAYHLSVLGLFFLLPLQWVKVRQGLRPFLLASVLAAAGIGGVEVALKAVTQTHWSALDSAVLGVPLVLIAGWVAIVAMERLGWRFLYRLLAVTAVAGLVTFPGVLGLLAQPAVSQGLQAGFDALWKQFSEAPGLNASGFTGTAGPAEFFGLLKQAFLGSFLLVFFLFWGLTARFSRAFVPLQEPRSWKQFFVPPAGALVLLGLWGVILLQGLLLRAGVRWDGGWGLYVVLNAAWIALVVHAMAGWGILQTLMDRWHVPRFGQTMVQVLLVFLLLVPGAGQWVVLAGLPVLAVLELWVNFRKRTQGVGL